MPTTKNTTEDDMNNASLYDIDYDEEIGFWCVFRSEKAIASYCSREEAQEYLNELLVLA